IQERVDNILTATDDQLISAMKFFISRMKIVVEPTGCLGAAVAFSGELDLRGKRVGVIISGGNVDLARLAHFIDKP
ncbi:TPA: serine dehydratase, partial [Yersinia enterocolitica]|nr:serine dehydratase [Yersinia enterocolitica]